MTKFTDLPIDILRIIYEEYEGNYKYRYGKFIPQIPFERKIPIFYVPIPKIFKVGNNWILYITLQQYNGYDDYSIVLVKQNFTHYCINYNSCIDCNCNNRNIFCYLYKQKGMGIGNGCRNMRGLLYNNTTYRFL